jgi:hypothetical protein
MTPRPIPLRPSRDALNNLALAVLTRACIATGQVRDRPGAAVRLPMGLLVPTAMASIQNVSGLAQGPEGRFRGTLNVR